MRWRFAGTALSAGNQHQRCMTGEAQQRLEKKLSARSAQKSDYGHQRQGAEEDQPGIRRENPGKIPVSKGRSIVMKKKKEEEPMVPFFLSYQKK